jgi:hypothetical protein
MSPEAVDRLLLSPGDRHRPNQEMAALVHIELGLDVQLSPSILA